MKKFRLLCLFVTLLALTACQSWQNIRSTDKLNDASRNYIRMVRWHELDQALLTFADKSVHKEFQQRVTAAENVNVVDYRIKRSECRPEKGEAEVLIDWDYYIPPSVTVKTVTDLQKWAYMEENGQGKWVLMTLLPEFR